MNLPHNPIDSSVVCLETEVIAYDPSDFVAKVRSDMRDRSLEWLNLHYPEFVFERFPRGAKRPTGFDIVRKGPRGAVTCARWRTAA